MKTQKSEQPNPFDAALVGMLACPACRGSLRVEGERLECEVCGRAYPVVDGIPMLIAERADQRPAG